MSQRGLTFVITEITLKERVKTRGQPLHDPAGSRGERVARCQNTAHLSAQRSGLGEEELVLLTLSGREKESWNFSVMDGAHRESGKQPQSGRPWPQKEGEEQAGSAVVTFSSLFFFYWAASGKSKRLQGFSTSSRPLVPPVPPFYHTLSFCHIGTKQEEGVKKLENLCCLVKREESSSKTQNIH